MIQIAEYTIRDNCTVFVAGSRQFMAEYKSHTNNWWLSEATWQSHKNGNPIQRPKSQRRPRYKRLEICDTLEECRERVALQMTPND